MFVPAKAGIHSVASELLKGGPRPSPGWRFGLRHRV